MKKLLFFILSFLVITSCEKSKLSPEDLGEDYLPIKTGNYIIYDVDSIVWDDFFDPVKIDTFVYQVKMEIGEDYENEEGKKTFRYIKEVKNDSTDWSIMNIYGISESSFGYKFLKNNLWTLELTLPVRIGEQWDWNSYNSDEEKICTIIDEAHNYKISSQSFDSCATVLVEDYLSLIDKDFHQDVYAKHIGLIHREITHINTKVNGEITSGYSLEYKINSYNTLK